MAAAATSDDDSGDHGAAAHAPATPQRPTDAPAGSGGGGAAIKLAVNPWTGSAVNANVAKVVLESKLGTPVDLVDIDENATWPGLDGRLDRRRARDLAVGSRRRLRDLHHEKKSVVDIGLLGPDAKIGWYVPTFVVDEHPELATWEGFKDPDAGQAVRHRRVRRPGPVPDG